MEIYFCFVGYCAIIEEYIIVDLFKYKFFRLAI